VAGLSDVASSFVWLGQAFVSALQQKIFPMVSYYLRSLYRIFLLTDSNAACQ